MRWAVRWRTGFTKAFEYSDCFVDDARLVVLNARDAADRGAVIRTRTRAVEARRDGRLLAGLLEDTRWHRREEQHQGARAGECRRAVGRGRADRRAGVNARAKVRLVQGSHIVVPKLYDHDRAYTFQNSDGRIVFVIPFQNDFTLIGTTDRDYDGDPSDVKASPEEIAYLCQSVNDYLAAGQAGRRGLDLCRRAAAV